MSHTITRTETRIERARNAVRASVQLQPASVLTPVQWARDTDPGAALVTAIKAMGVTGQAIANATGALGVPELSLNASTASRVHLHPRETQPRTLFALAVVYLLACECHGAAPHEDLAGVAMRVALAGTAQGRFASLSDSLRDALVES